MIKLTDFKFFANNDGELYVSVADLKKRLKEEYQVKTNYDRIRNMSVEEMSNFLMHWFADCMIGKAPMNVKTWLNSEVEK